MPLIQPYSPNLRTAVNGVGSYGITPEALAMGGDSALVDWVWLELLSATDTATVLSTRTGVLHRDGWVTQGDGVSPIDFGAGAGSYFLRVAHRNHLSATLAEPVTLGLDTVSIDLTDPGVPLFGTEAMMEVNGVRMLWPGDVNSDGQVKYVGADNDRDRVLITIGGVQPTATVTGYEASDVNMDGTVRYTGSDNDRDVILQTIGGSVPHGVRTEQGPQ
jgi:hypothetical protein